jgi:hypothetical protein
MHVYGVAESLAGVAGGMGVGVAMETGVGAGVAVMFISGICESSIRILDWILFRESLSRFGVSGFEISWGTSGSGFWDRAL